MIRFHHASRSRLIITLVVAFFLVVYFGPWDFFFRPWGLSYLFHHSSPPAVGPSGTTGSNARSGPWLSDGYSSANYHLDYNDFSALVGRFVGIVPAGFRPDESQFLRRIPVAQLRPAAGDGHWAGSNYVIIELAKQPGDGEFLRSVQETYLPNFSCEELPITSCEKIKAHLAERINAQLADRSALSNDLYSYTAGQLASEALGPPEVSIRTYKYYRVGDYVSVLYWSQADDNRSMPVVQEAETFSPQGDILSLAAIVPNSQQYSDELFYLTPEGVVIGQLHDEFSWQDQLLPENGSLSELGESPAAANVVIPYRQTLLKLDG